ncbi:tniQ family protein [Collimonas arenae]|nr:tniQ family protein [Collimonas arenae]
MINLSTLPFRGAPYPHESGMGFALRMSNVNGLNGLYWLYKLLNREKLNHFLPEDIPAIATLFGCDADALSEKFVHQEHHEGDVSYSAHMHTINRHYLLRHLRPQLCPVCISEFGYTRSVWDFSLIGACHFHQCVLIDECPNCAKRIQWARPSLQSCTCGFLWHQTKLQRLDTSHPCIQFSQVIDCQLQPTCGIAFSETDAIPRFLTNLSLDVAFRIVWAFGIKTSDSDIVSTGVSRTILRTHQARHFTENAFRRLSRCLRGAMDQTSTLTTQIHMPSLYKLVGELESPSDLNSVGLLLSCLGVSTQKNRMRWQHKFNQLNLF